MGDETRAILSGSPGEAWLKPRQRFASSPLPWRPTARPGQRISTAVPPPPVSSSRSAVALYPPSPATVRQDHLRVTLEGFRRPGRTDRKPAVKDHDSLTLASGPWAANPSASPADVPARLVSSDPAVAHPPGRVEVPRGPLADTRQRPRELSPVAANLPAPCIGSSTCRSAPPRWLCVVPAWAAQEPADWRQVDLRRTILQPEASPEPSPRSGGSNRPPCLTSQAVQHPAACHRTCSPLCT